MLEIFDKDFNAAIIKTFSQAHVNFLETNKNTENLSNRKK